MHTTVREKTIPADQFSDINRTTWLGMVLNIILGLAKAGIGLVSGSQALLADGIHSFSDLVTDVALLLGVKYWSRPPDDCHPYGHGRIETAVNLFIGGAILSVAIGIAVQALDRINTPVENTLGLPALGVAVFSIITKEWLFRWTLNKGKKNNCRALMANAWHHRSDSLSSMPVAVAVLWGYFFPRHVYIDSIAAIIVTVMLGHAGIKILWPSLRELLEFREDERLEQWLLEQSRLFPDIMEVHHIRSRRVGSAVLLDLHLLVNGETTVYDAHTLATDFKHYLRGKDPRIADVLIHLEPDCESLKDKPAS
ncbi:MAG: cation diffusion facilitator family transporter [Lentisphaeria bacterium]|nr:cation diffusion facilitator family transporter [Lentisphaeria bacterium]